MRKDKMAGLRNNNNTQNAQWADYMGDILQGSQPINQLVPQHPYLKDIPGLEDFQFEKTQYIMVLTIPEALRLLTDRAVNLFNSGYTEATKYISTHSAKEITFDVLHLYDAASKKGIDYFSVKDTVEWLRFSRNIMTSYDQAGNLAWHISAILKVRATTIIINGTAYIKISGYAGLRRIIKGTRYLFNNAQMLEFGIGFKGMMDKTIKGMKYNIWFSAGFHALQLIFDSEYDFADFFSDMPMDVAKLIVNSGVLCGTAWAMTALHAPVILAGGIIIGMAIGTVIMLEWLDSDKVFGTSAFLKKAIKEGMESYRQQIVHQAKTLPPGEFMLLRTMTNP